jgi:hypothetical protein
MIDVVEFASLVWQRVETYLSDLEASKQQKGKRRDQRRKCAREALLQENRALSIVSLKSCKVCAVWLRLVLPELRSIDPV